MRKGILGGTFDPFHVAHGYMAEETLRLLDLDEIIVMPNGDPPHKDESVTDSYHRYNMASLALKDIDGITVSDFEIRKGKPSYTYLTLESMRKDMDPSDVLFFIIGRDSLISFHRWAEPERILKNAVLVCFDRPGYREEEVAEASRFIEEKGGELILLDSLELEISSTDIRRRIKEGNPIRSFLHKDVLEYIEKNGLYK